ncbi:MAG: MBL fold metallo-hydrolase [Clostridia bacterium]|nr:MAG: MBL fold metallo-hydrolase [Clostridia bacterium]
MFEPAITRVKDWGDGSLYLIDLPQELRGYHHFISSWAIKTETGNLLVDVGPAATIPLLRQALKDLEINRVDYVLLTHIHIDHAGGTGLLLETFPQARVVCHPPSQRHLLDPARLWQGSLEVLGEVAVKYGPINPVPDGRLAETAPDVKVISAPGHAPHHLAFLYRDCLFAGEAGGVYFDVGEVYLRPATPPTFLLPVAMATLDRLLAFNLEGCTICYGHYGWASSAARMLERHRGQLLLWDEVIPRVAGKRPGRSDGDKELISAVWKELEGSDELFARFYLLPADIQERERYFITNSIKGFLGYLLSGPGDQGANGPGHNQEYEGRNPGLGQEQRPGGGYLSGSGPQTHWHGSQGEKAAEGSHKAALWPRGKEPGQGQQGEQHQNCVQVHLHPGIGQAAQEHPQQVGGQEGEQAQQQEESKRDRPALIHGREHH